MNWSLPATFSALVDRKATVPLRGDGVRAMGLCGVMLLSALVIVVAALAARITVARWPRPAVFIVQQGNPPVRLRTLDTPSLSALRVQNWTAHALRDIFRFNFVDYDQHMSDVQSMFTPSGWTAFQAGLASGNVEQHVKNGNLDVFLVPTHAARVVKAGLSGDTLAYTVQMPALMIYRSASSVATVPILATVVVKQVPAYENPQGLGISDLIVPANPTTSQ